jgi:hypothetical protein
VPFESGQSVSVQVAVASPPAFTVTAPADGAVVDLPEGGGEVDVALALPGEQFFPVTITISQDGHTTSEQFTGPQYRKMVALAPMPLGPRPISVSVANLDSVGPAQTRTVTGRDITAPQPRVDSPQPSASVLGDANGAVTVPMHGTAPDSQSGMASGSAGVASALSPSGARTPARGAGVTAGRPAGGDSEPGWRPGVAWLRPGSSRAAGRGVLPVPAQLDALHQHPGPGDEVERAGQQREGDRADACRISS